MVGRQTRRSTHRGVSVNIWSIIDLLQPVCAVCGLSTGSGMPLCAGCRKDLPVIEPACERCALPLTAGHLAPGASGYITICPHCRRRPPPVGRAVAACRYDFPVDRLVQRLKFGGQLPLARVFGCLLSDRVRAAYACDHLPAALIPVPLHPQRRRQRGFNQAERIALVTGRALGLPVLAGCVTRQRNTAAQSGLGLGARRRNLRAAFRLCDDATSALPAHVALVDDVITSGSTVLALAATLRAAGVVRVDAWAVARTA